MFSGCFQFCLSQTFLPCEYILEVSGEECPPIPFCEHLCSFCQSCRGTRPCAGTPGPGPTPPTLLLLQWALALITHSPPGSGLLLSPSPESKWNKIWVILMVLLPNTTTRPTASNQICLISTHPDELGINALPNSIPTRDLWSMSMKLHSLSLSFVLSPPAGIYYLKPCPHTPSPELVQRASPEPSTEWLLYQ